MKVQFTRPSGVLIGDTVFVEGETAELEDAHAHRLIKSGAATVPIEVDPVPEVETADAPPAPESASAEPGRRRKV